MFWKKKKSVPIKPAGVLLDIQVNLSTIGDIADGNRPLTIDDLSNLWASENSCTQTFRLAVIQQDGVVALVRHAPDRDALLRDTQLTMDLDFQVGRDRDGFVYVELIAGCLGVSLPDCSLMLVPVEHVLRLLAGIPLVDTSDLRRATTGQPVHLGPDTDAETGVRTVLAIGNVAMDRFSFENSAVRLRAWPVWSELELGAAIGRTTEQRD